jgi:hypothetical protein
MPQEVDTDSKSTWHTCHLGGHPSISIQAQHGSILECMPVCHMWHVAFFFLCPAFLLSHSKPLEKTKKNGTNIQLSEDSRTLRPLQARLSELFLWVVQNF